jgi:hypothetical protein
MRLTKSSRGAQGATKEKVAERIGEVLENGWLAEFLLSGEEEGQERVASQHMRERQSSSLALRFIQPTEPYNGRKK